MPLQFTMAEKQVEERRRSSRLLRLSWLLVAAFTVLAILAVLGR